MGDILIGDIIIRYYIVSVIFQPLNREITFNLDFSISSFDFKANLTSMNTSVVLTIVSHVIIIHKCHMSTKSTILHMKHDS